MEPMYYVSLSDRMGRACIPQELIKGLFNLRWLIYLALATLSHPRDGGRKRLQNACTRTM